MNIKPILIATAVALTAANANATCTIAYNCGTDASGTAPAQQSITTATTTFTASTGDTCTKTGYVISHWLAVSGSKTTAADGVAIPGAEYNVSFLDNTKTCSNGTVTMTLTAQWMDATEYATHVITPTSKSYTDSQMNSKQPAFSGLGNSKLMTYGTTDGAVGSRDIVTTLGDSTTANTVPTLGAINTALNTKQNTMNGTAGWVAENTGTAGSLKAKPVYSTTNNYKTALVTASDLNQIVTDAVNSELIQVDETGTASSTGTLWKLNDVANLILPTLRLLLPDSSINSTSYCYRNLSGTNDSNGDCNAATLSTLGSSGNKSGLWGVVFPYGDMVGKSVCSATQGTKYTAATDAQNTSLNNEFSAQSGVGTNALSDSQINCWCKMDSINGAPAVSRWVFYATYINLEASYCAENCAFDCVMSVDMDPTSTFRAAMFNSVQ